MPSLRTRVLRGSFVTIAGYGTGQLIRFVGNIVLTRLLFPEAFGLMVLVNVVLRGLVLFSDFGLGLAVVQNPRGEEPRFYNTVWTMGIFRGILLTLIGCLLAQPAATYFGNDALVPYMRVAALEFLLSSSLSTSIHLCTRKLNLGPVVAIEILSQVVGLAVMILIAWQFRTVWALVLGGSAVGSIRLILSHSMVPGPRMKLMLDWEVVREVFHFGKWLFISTAVTFFVVSMDRLVLGRIMSEAELGVYAIAFALANMTSELLGRLANSVLLPVYSRVLESGDTRGSRSKLRKMRAFYCVGSLPLVVAMMFFGQFFIDKIYDSRWAAAGWMLQLMALGAGFSVVTSTLSPILLARGHSRQHMYWKASQLAILLGLVSLLGYHFGVAGIIWAGVLARVLDYPLIRCFLRDYDLITPELDIPMILVIAGLGALSVL